MPMTANKVSSKKALNKALNVVSKPLMKKGAHHGHPFSLRVNAFFLPNLTVFQPRHQQLTQTYNGKEPSSLR